MQVDLQVLLSLQLLLQHQLLTATLLDLSLRLHKLLLLLHGLLHDFSSLQELTLHVINLFEKLLLLGLFFLLLFVFFVELSDDALSFFLGDLLLREDA